MQMTSINWYTLNGKLVSFFSFFFKVSNTLIFRSCPYVFHGFSIEKEKEKENAEENWSCGFLIWM